jgi:hypothetical protein
MKANGQLHSQFHGREACSLVNYANRHIPAPLVGGGGILLVRNKKIF